MAIYFTLAHGTKTLEMSNNFLWPYDIDICFDKVERPVTFSEGVGWGSVGRTVTVNEALGEQWRAHFEMTDALWLIPYLERVAMGIPLEKEEMLSEYQRRNGKVPSSYPCTFS